MKCRGMMFYIFFEFLDQKGYVIRLRYFDEPWDANLASLVCSIRKPRGLFPARRVIPEWLNRIFARAALIKDFGG